MTKQEVMNYVTETPHNVNKNILGQKLDEFQKNVSWNDLKDKPFYTEMEVILEKQTFEFVDGEVELPYFTLILGEIVSVYLNGSTYEVRVEDYRGGAHIVPVMVDSVTNTGYLIYSNFSNETASVQPFGADENPIEIGIYRENVHRLDHKYMPCDLMFEFNQHRSSNPKIRPDRMDKPTIVEGSLDAVLKKLVNGKIPVVKVRYTICEINPDVPFAYCSEFICDAWLYGTDVMFAHDVPNIESKTTVQINMSTDDPDFMEVRIYAYATPNSAPIVIN